MGDGDISGQLMKIISNYYDFKAVFLEMSILDGFLQRKKSTFLLELIF